MWLCIYFCAVNCLSRLIQCRIVKCCSPTCSGCSRLQAGPSLSSRHLQHPVPAVPLHQALAAPGPPAEPFSWKLPEPDFRLFRARMRSSASSWACCMRVASAPCPRSELGAAAASCAMGSGSDPRCLWRLLRRSESEPSCLWDLCRLLCSLCLSDESCRAHGSLSVCVEGPGCHSTASLQPASCCSTVRVSGLMGQHSACS